MSWSCGYGDEEADDDVVVTSFGDGGKCWTLKVFTNFYSGISNDGSCFRY